jgi:hypothetical protein
LKRIGKIYFFFTTCRSIDERRIIQPITLDADQKEPTAMEKCGDLKQIAQEPRFHRFPEEIKAIICCGANWLMNAMC